jgi:hypothetical protein
MTTLLAMKRVGRAATLALALVVPVLSTAAYAFDPEGGDESLVFKSAQSARYGDPTETPLSRATAQARAVASRLAANASAGASDTPAARGIGDLIGQGGQQDTIAREIYHPGTTIGQ